MSIFDLFGKKTTLEKTAQRLYKSKGALYLPKGERQVYNILISLAKIYGYNIDNCDYSKCEEILSSYIVVAVRQTLHGSPIWITKNSLKMRCPNLVKDDETAIKAALFSQMNFKFGEFTLSNKEDRENFEYGFAVANGTAPINPTKSMKDRTVELKKQVNQTKDRMTGNSNQEGYYFDNALEFFAYIENHGENKQLNWLKGSQFKDLFMQGYREFDAGNYKNAMGLFVKSMEFNPVALASRFEMAQIMVIMQLFKRAANLLNGTFNYLWSESDISTFYRRYGFLAIELNQRHLASALLRYSMQFDNNQYVQTEYEYLKHYALQSDDFDNVNISDEFKRHNIPLITISDSAREIIQKFK